MKQLERFMGVALMLLALASCSSEEEESTTTYMLPKAKPMTLTAEQQTMVNETNDFSFSLFRTIQQASPTQSLAFSPLSVVYNLGMINNGATGQTQQEITSTLGVSYGTERLNTLCQSLIEGLPEVDQDVDILSANAIYTNKGFSLKDNYQKVVKNYYHADAQTLDFHSSKALSTINGWAKKQTDGMIPQVLDDINADAVAYLLSSVYFKATWTKKFDRAKTLQETFTTSTGAERSVPMMHNNAAILGYDTDDYTAICLPYGNGENWYMYILLPAEGKTISDVASQLNGQTWSKIVQGRQSYELDLKLPKFSTANKTDFSKPLIDMGIKRMFTPSAELREMCKEAGVFVGEMFQKAKIDVDEEGTKASAVTVSGNWATCPLHSGFEKGEFHANRPFVYVITESSSNTIVFIGTYQGN